MVIFQVDFIFCCPSFVDDISEIGYFPYTKKYELVHFIHKGTLRCCLILMSFKMKKPC